MKLGVAVIASLYFLWCAYDPYQWHLIDGVNLVIHEAGHLILQSARRIHDDCRRLTLPGNHAGTLRRLFLVPQQILFGALVLFWVGESILNVSVYAGDSLALQLPLLGGEDSIHDWNYLLS